MNAAHSVLLLATGLLRVLTTGRRRAARIWGSLYELTRQVEPNGGFWP